MYRNKCIHSDSSVSITDCTLVNSISLVDDLMWRCLSYIYVLWAFGPCGGEQAKNVQFPLRTFEQQALVSRSGGQLQCSTSFSEHSNKSYTCSQPETYPTLSVSQTLSDSLYLVPACSLKDLCKCM